jgi:Protein of unknown function (DUF2914)
MMKKIRPKFGVFLAVGLLAGIFCVPAVADQVNPPGSGVTLVRAVMSEYIEEYEPQNSAAAFSINVGKISCFTSFDSITTTTATVHKWFRRDELVTAKRLTLKPPSWSTYSSIQLREADKGPWRVEIWDDHNHLLQTLRFSVTD